MDHPSVVVRELGQSPDAREGPCDGRADTAALADTHSTHPLSPVVEAAVCRDRPLEILYRDAHLVAIAKPRGLLVHRTRLDWWATDFAVQRLRDQLGCPVYPAHRLDKATSGVLLFALTQAVRVQLGAAFERGAVTKRYVAIVRGWPADRLHIDRALERLGDAYDTSTTSAAGPQAAVTLVARLATAELPVQVDRYPTSRYSLVALEPRSGRRHQLRRHLKHAGYPIIGDTTYGQGRHNRLFRSRFGCERLLLTAVSLDLAHPRLGTPLHIDAAPAEDFLNVATLLGWPDAAALARAAGSDPWPTP